MSTMMYDEVNTSVATNDGVGNAVEEKSQEEVFRELINQCPQLTMEGLKKEAMHKDVLRQLVTGMYDIQKLRVATGNRIVSVFNRRMGLDMQKKQSEQSDKEANSIISVLKKEYKRITDGYVNGFVEVSYDEKDEKGNKVKKQVTVEVKRNSSIAKVIESLNSEKSDEHVRLQHIAEKFDYDLMGTYQQLLDSEENTKKLIVDEVHKHPMWDRFFEKVPGCGEVMAAVCLVYLDIHKARHVSSFYKYAGLDVVPVTETVVGEDGEEREEVVMIPLLDEWGNPCYDDEGNQKMTMKFEGRSMKHTEMREYLSRDGEVKLKKSITYNPFLKTKLIGVLATSFIKVKRGKYCKAYYDYKNRKTQMGGYTNIAIERMSQRYAVKLFLRDLWVTWRAYMGYKVSLPYEVEFLHRNVHEYNEYHTVIAKLSGSEHTDDDFLQAYIRECSNFASYRAVSKKDREAMEAANAAGAVN